MRNFLVILLAVLIVGCTTGGPMMSRSFSSAQVSLEKNNFRMIKANAKGASSGFSLFGIIPFAVPSNTVAMSRLYDSAGVHEAKAYALVNMDQEQTSLYLILFSIPTYRVRADVVEFVDTNEKETAPASK